MSYKNLIFRILFVKTDPFDEICSIIKEKICQTPIFSSNNLPYGTTNVR
jgi:hypothetical protein